MAIMHIYQNIIEAARRLYNRNMLAAADGNISYRVSDEQIIVTPSGISKAHMHSDEMAEITIDNVILRGNPSSERLMHLAIYQHCSRAKCVVHAHPPIATAWSIAKPHLTELPSHGLSELILAVGKIPIVPYARPSTQAMGQVLLPFLPHCQVMILARHGAIAWGETLDEAVNGIERLEHAAQVLLAATQLGGITDLPVEEITALHAMRANIGERII